MLKDTNGKRLVFSLLDTTGYSAEIQAKYIGMLIFERPVTLGDATIPAGAYGFGLKKAQVPESGGTLPSTTSGGPRWARRPRPTTRRSSGLCRCRWSPRTA